MGLFAGLDWGATRHAVCVVDEAGKIVAQFEVTHDAQGLSELLKRLAKLRAPGELRVAIERPSGLIVDALVAAGYAVVPVHPNIVKACRSRYRAAGAKSDSGDGYLLADLLRTDGHRFRCLAPQSDAIKALRALVRTREDLIAQRIALANQLRALLESFWPGASALFAGIDSPIALAFLRRYPTPRSAAQLGEKRLRVFLTRQRYCGRKTAVELLARLRGEPAGLAAQMEMQAKGQLVQVLARVLETVVGELAELTARIERQVSQLADGRIIMSLPRAGRLNAAQILVELGDVRERFQSEAQLAAEAGVAPVTRQSGKSRGVGFRHACNRRLRCALTIWVDNSRHASPWAADIYRRARERGCDHPHATRILARAWVRVLWRTWTDRTIYDPTQHNGAKAFLPVLQDERG